jgi:hypothetical protein
MVKPRAGATYEGRNHSKEVGWRRPMAAAPRTKIGKAVVAALASLEMEAPMDGAAGEAAAETMREVVDVRLRIRDFLILINDGLISEAVRIEWACKVTELLLVVAAMALHLVERN